MINRYAHKHKIHFFLFGGFGGYFLQMVTDLNNRVALLLKYSGKWKSEVEVES